MKRLSLFSIILIVISSLLDGQELVTKKGFKILPEQGDYALGFNAVPVIDFALNAVNIMVNTGQTAAHPSYVTGFNQNLVGKYFLDEKKAIRGIFGINAGSATNRQFAKSPHDQLANPGNPDAWKEVEDVKVVRNSNVVLGGGIEFRRGHNRLQGFYGGEALVGFLRTTNVNTWGVVMDTIAINNNFTNLDGSALNGRILKNVGGLTVRMGLRGFAGVEYFILPKISIGAEFGWSFGIGFTGRGEVTTENWDNTNRVPKEVTTKGNASTSFWGFNVDNGIANNLGSSAALNLIFHF
ncbi:MAG: hypothetical protein N2Z72_05720 [Bacteroidales bacterium]|nr:hypothetical protein [Bacteroidales bacterium]